MEFWNLINAGDNVESRPRFPVGRKIVGRKYPDDCIDTNFSSTTSNVDFFENFGDLDSTASSNSSFRRTPTMERSQTENHLFLPFRPRENSGLQHVSYVNYNENIWTYNENNVARQNPVPQYASSPTPIGFKVMEGNNKLQVQATKKPLINKFGDKPCTFCRTNGESACIYSTHTLKDQYGDVACPVLASHVCDICGATGKKAHTLTYCPVMIECNSGKRPTSTALALKRSRVKSNGQRRY